MNTRVTTLVVLLGTAASIAPVGAGGMVLPVRGVRDVERGGALVAGAEDADSMWLNPAGLAHLVGKTTLLVGAMYVGQDIDYTRIDSGDNTLPTISSDHPGIPAPTLAAAFAVGDKLVIAGGSWTPYAGLHRYDLDGTQRYGSISIAETKILHLTIAAAYAVSPKLRIGATVQNVINHLDSRVVLSGCPGQTVCAPEDPEFDADTRISQTDLFAPTGSLGIQYDATPQLTVGAMLSLPSRVSGATGTLQTKLPSSGFYEGATVVGDQASLEMTMPATAHAGVEYRPSSRLRIEAALHIELWSSHDAITITPKGMSIDNVAGVGTYMLGPTVIPRNYRNSYAPAIGGEYRIGNAMVGAGYSYETAAAPEGYVSPLTVDSAKHLIGLGGSYHGKTWTLGGSVGFVKLTDVEVSLEEARVPQLTPVRGQPSEVYINAGSYESSYLLAGLRFSKQL